MGSIFQKPHKNHKTASSPQTFQKQNQKIKKKIIFVQYFGGKMWFCGFYVVFEKLISLLFTFIISIYS